jgi:hypothetical protein
MSGRRANPYRVKIHWNYTARELADRLGIHKNTVRAWQHDGLVPIDRQRPSLFHGGAVRAFLIARRATLKQPCPTGTLYCFRCREPRQPVPTLVEYIQLRPGTGRLRAPCSDCGTTMNRRVRQAAIHGVLPGLLVQIRLASPRLSEKDRPSFNCALTAEGVRR